MMDLSDYIDEVKAGLSNIPNEYYDENTALKDLEKAYRYIYLITTQAIRDQMNNNNLSDIEGCLVALATYYGYRNWTTLASQRDGSMPESSPVQLSYLMEDARNCLAWISSVPLDENMMPERQTFAAVGAVSGTTILNYY